MIPYFSMSSLFCPSLIQVIRVNCFLDSLNICNYSLLHSGYSLYSVSDFSGIHLDFFGA